MRSKNIILSFLGLVFSGLGTIGIVLPVLPSFPFFLLALVCFSKGSKKFHGWFTSTKIYRRRVEPFLKTRSMTAASKIRILFLVTALISVPIALLDVLPVRILFGVIILLHYVYFIFFVKTASKEEISERRRETGEQAKG